MLPQVPEPVHHPSPARAVVGPTALIPAAGGVAIGLAAGSNALAVVLGIVAWLTGGALALGRGRRRGRDQARPAPIDPWAVPEPWRQYVRQAQSAGQRFDQAVQQGREGPLRERLLTLQPLVMQAVEEVWSVARRGAALSGPSARPGGGATDRQRLGAELQEVQAERLRLDPAATGPAEVLAGREAAIAAQIRAARRAEDAAGEAADRLRLMTAQLDEAVTEVLELGLGPGGDADPAAMDALAPSLQNVVQQIQALQDGLRSIEAIGLAPTAGPVAAAGQGPGTAPVSSPPAVPPSAPPAS